MTTLMMNNNDKQTTIYKYKTKKYTIIVKIQGELVDNIVHHVTATSDFVNAGHLELIQAEEYQSRARKVFF